MLDSGQFLHILAAEAEHLVTILVFIPQEVKSSFERKLLEAFSSDSFSETAKAWNAERLRVVEEVIEQHLIPAGIKWTREFIREEVEDYLAEQCSDRLRSVSFKISCVSGTDLLTAYRYGALSHA
jgi:transcription elongation factor SPT6